MSTENTSSTTVSRKRVVTTLLVFFLFGMYLWGIQLASEKAAGLAKGLLFSLVLFGGGLSWDILKEIARLPDDRLASFLSAFGSTLGWMVSYALSALLAMLVVTPIGAGLPTIGVGIYWLFSAWALYKFFINFDRAYKAVIGI